jgi:MSHA biogenesis protein MshP
MRPEPPPRTRARGFAFVAALFLLVVLGGFGAFVVTMGSNAQASTTLAIQGVRAFEAANAGLEWAAYQELDPRQAIWGSVTTPPDCFASPSSPSMPAAMGGFTVSVSCTRYPAFAASPNYYEEGSQRVVIYVFTATASLGTPGAADTVERQLESRVEACRNPYATAPAYACASW